MAAATNGAMEKAFPSGSQNIMIEESFLPAWLLHLPKQAKSAAEALFYGHSCIQTFASAVVLAGQHDLSTFLANTAMPVKLCSKPKLLLWGKQCSALLNSYFSCCQAKALCCVVLCGG